MRYRKHISIVESTLMATQQAQSAIDWEMNRRYGRSKQLSVTIDSWRDKDGKLWEPNTLIPVDLPTLRLPKTELLLAEVTYMRDDYGTIASFLCAYRDTEHGCKFSKRRNVFDKKLAQEDKKSPCANALLQVTNTI